MKKIVRMILTGIALVFLSMPVNAEKVEVKEVSSPSHLATLDRAPKPPFLERGNQIFTESKDINFLKTRMITIVMPCVHNPGKPVPTPSVEELFRSTVKTSTKYTILLATPSQDIQTGCISVSYLFIETSEFTTTK